jgi:phosphoenolpyruvate carboxykinase (ATP)
LLNALLDGDLLNVEYSTDPIFGFKVPKSCPGIPDEVLNPASSWKNQDEYKRRYISLASRFIDNMKKFEDSTPLEVINAGPKI